MQALVYVDGKMVPKGEAVVSVFDHGFLYGDGVFEGIRVYEGNVFRLRQHIDRLYESAKTIALDIPMSREEMIQATLETVAANLKKDVYIRLVVSRGPGDLGIDPAKCRRPTVVIIADSISLYPQELYDHGAPLVTASVRRIPMESLDPRIKSLNYLNNILAKIEAKQAGALEAIMLNHHGQVAECTADNLFMVKQGTVKTPDLMQGALAGITRAAVLDLARAAEIPCSETVLALHDLYNADECFLTGTGAEVVPVITIDGRRIGDGKPGPITKRLLADFRVLRTQDGIKVPYKEPVAR
ncbi:MAG: branched-chain-amino-acid transaminase [Acidobacteriia bacterium]|nr:branched-chain-amino-acid transaminase [Terriglobia bacterium]